jgi:hypothetical protein
VRTIVSTSAATPIVPDEMRLERPIMLRKEGRSTLGVPQLRFRYESHEISVTDVTTRLLQMQLVPECLCS